MRVDMAAEGTFEYALIKLKMGLAVTRRGWNAPGQIVYMVQPDSYPPQTAIARLIFPQGPVPYDGYFALKNSRGTVSTWVPSVSDLLSDDWEEVDLALLQQKNQEAQWEEEDRDASEG